MTPRERVKAFLASCPVWDTKERWEEEITGIVTSAISDQTAALQAALEDAHRYKMLHEERGELVDVMRAEIEKVSTERNAAQERVTEERDALVLTTKALQGVHPAIVLAAIQWWGIDKAGDVARKKMAAHDRQVAARVLRETAAEARRRAGAGMAHFYHFELKELGDAYERGEREVPGE